MLAWWATETLRLLLSHELQLNRATPSFPFFIDSLISNAEEDLQPYCKLNIISLAWKWVL